MLPKQKQSKREHIQEKNNMTRNNRYEDMVVRNKLAVLSPDFGVLADNI